MIFMGWCAARFRAPVADGSRDLCIMHEDCKGDAELLGGFGGDAMVAVPVRAAFLTARVNFEARLCGLRFFRRVRERGSPTKTFPALIGLCFASGNIGTILPSRKNWNPGMNIS